MTRTTAAALFALTSLLIASTASAQITGAPTGGYIAAPGVPSQTMPKPLLEIGFDQKIDGKLPLDATFRDEQGQIGRAHV